MKVKVEVVTRYMKDSRLHLSWLVVIRVRSAAGVSDETACAAFLERPDAIEHAAKVQKRMNDLMRSVGW